MKLVNIEDQHVRFVKFRILGIIPGAYELNEIAELIKEETKGNVIIETDKNTMKSLMEVKQGAINFDIENSIAPLLGLSGTCLACHEQSSFADNYDIISTILLPSLLTLITFLVNTNA